MKKECFHSVVAGMGQYNPSKALLCYEFLKKAMTGLTAGRLDVP
jgi:hypothetical protein